MCGSLWHSFAGNMQEYVKYPELILTVGILIGVSMTTIIINDWKFVLLKATTNVLNTFQSKLIKMKEIT